jgi:hypothetical protein
MIINWNGYPDNGAVSYGLGTILTWTSSIPPSDAEWTKPTAVHSKCGEDLPLYPATKFIDNNTGTLWAHDINHLHWIILDLEQTYSVSGVRIYVQSSTKSKWTSVDVYVSDDPANMGAAVATGLDFTTLNSWNERTFTAKNGRYVKLDGIDTQDGGNRLYGYEFDAYCAAVAGETSIPVFMRYYRNMRET